MTDRSHVLAAQNAAENLLALAGGFGAWSERRACYVIADSGTRGCRVCVARPAEDADGAIGEMTRLAADNMPTSVWFVEDAFGTLPLEHHGFTPVSRMPVMVRPARAEFPVPEPPSSVEVIAAADQADVDDVERLMVDGMPLPLLQPWRPGALFPPGAAAIPGWVMWLARRDGEPLGCCATFDNGASVGVYGMVVLPGARRQGIGRALVAAIVRRYPGVPHCLSATEDGFWLYAGAGYRTVGQACWWRRAPQ